jgi:sulfate transport system ATP-binding protein
MSVFENVAFALRVRGWPREQVKRRVEELLALIRLDGFGNRRPAELSGGQRQRVALARALAAQPRVLLLDEPFGALDARVRQELRQWLRGLHRQVPCTTILVTHDQEEAFEVADRVVVMNHGQVEQAGSPHDVFDRPASAFVMGFLGNANAFPARVQNGRAFLGEMEFPCPEYPHAEPGSATVFVRPHELDVVGPAAGQGRGSGLHARVLHVHPAGAVSRVHLAAEDGTTLSVEISPERYRELDLKAGDTVYVAPRNARVFVPHRAG